MDRFILNWFLPMTILNDFEDFNITDTDTDFENLITYLYWYWFFYSEVNYKLRVLLDLGRLLFLLCVVLRVWFPEYAIYFHKSVDLCLRSCDLIFMK